VIAFSDTYDNVDWQQPISDDPLYSGLVAAYHAADALSYGGRVWKNLVSNQYHGTLTGGPTWSGKSPPGGAGSLKFAGSNQYVNLGNYAALQPPKITVATRVKADSISGHSIAGNDYPLNTNKGWSILGFFGTDIYWDIGLGGTGLRCNSNYAVGLGKWAQIVGTYDGAVSRLYFNTVEVDTASGAGSISPTTANATALGLIPGLGLPMLGNMSEFLVYSRALSPSEVHALYLDSLRGYPRLLNRFSFPAIGEVEEPPQLLDGSLVGDAIVGDANTVSAILIKGILDNSEFGDVFSNRKIISISSDDIVMFGDLTQAIADLRNSIVKGVVLEEEWATNLLTDSDITKGAVFSDLVSAVATALETALQENTLAGNIFVSSLFAIAVLTEGAVFGDFYDNVVEKLQSVGANFVLGDVLEAAVDAGGLVTENFVLGDVSEAEVAAGDTGGLVSDNLILGESLTSLLVGVAEKLEKVLVGANFIGDVSADAVISNGVVSGDTFLGSVYSVAVLRRIIHSYRRRRL